MPDLSIVVTTIRPQNWKRFYVSAQKGCKQHTFEVIFVGPFKDPDFDHIENTSFIQDYGCPTRAAQIGALAAKGRLLYYTADDGVFFPDTIDYNIDYYDRNCSKKDVINMRYRESAGFSLDKPFDSTYWRAGNQPELQLPGVNPSWQTSLQPLLRLDYFKELGGWDAQWWHVNFSFHDFVFRIQADGGTVLHSIAEAMAFDHMPGETGDHGPIHTSHLYHDYPLFRQVYSIPTAAFDRIHIPIDNWKQSPTIWDHRFDPDNLPAKYEDLL